MNSKSIDKRRNKVQFGTHFQEIRYEIQREQDLKFFEIENIIMERIQRLKDERKRKQRLFLYIIGMLIIFFLLTEFFFR